MFSLQGLLKKHRTIAIWVAIVPVFIVLYFIYVPVSLINRERVEIIINEGDGLYAVADKLSDNGLLLSIDAFVFYVLMIGQDKSIKSGRYLLPRSLSVAGTAKILVRGLSESDDVTATIPEGFNIWEIDRRFASLGLIQEGRLSRNYLHKEGRLFPDTYRFKKDVSLEGMVNKMEENYMAKGGTRSDEILIVASLLEKEAKTKEDMELIAGIIEKRLKLGMLLQIDASVGYGWCLKEEAKKNKGFCDVTQAPVALEIKIDGPYNTYMRDGLPAGAISNPGTMALEAAANPKASDYLYYLSTRDGSQIIYAKTPEEHAANRRKYLGI